MAPLDYVFTQQTNTHTKNSLIFTSLFLKQKQREKSTSFFFFFFFLELSFQIFSPQNFLLLFSFRVLMSKNVDITTTFLL